MKQRLNYCLLRLMVAACLLPGSSLAEALPYLRCFEIASQRHEVPIETLAGVARVESNFNPDARSHANAHGIMQIRWPLTAKHLGVRRVSELYNPCVNIDIGAGYLAELLARYNGNSTLAIAAYNYGPTRLQTESDIPASVLGYVNRVRASKSAWSDVEQDSGRDLMLNEFKSQQLAQRYADTINNFMDRSLVQVVSTDNRYRAYLNRSNLSRMDHLRLSRIINLH